MTKYPLQKVFLVCVGKSCNAMELGEQRGACIQDELKAHNKSLGRKTSVRVVQSSCLDMCDHGPNMVVYPGGNWYSHLDRVKARAVYDEEMGDEPGPRAEG
jgi:(2Fe-2S) ferredoxin